MIDRPSRPTTWEEAGRCRARIERVLPGGPPTPRDGNDGVTVSLSRFADVVEQ